MRWRPADESIVCAHGVDVWEPLGVLRLALQHSNLILAPSKEQGARCSGTRCAAGADTRSAVALDPHSKG